MTDGSPIPTARRQETRSRLIDAAAQVFVEEGLQGASVESICARAGFTRGAFYSNFASKEELFLTALGREHELRVELIEQKASALLPTLHARAEPLGHDEVAYHVADFLDPTDAAAEWFALETEYLLLAIRDRDLAPAFTSFVEHVGSKLSNIVEKLILAAGRQPRMPVSHAISVFISEYERAQRVSILAGPDAPGGLAIPGPRITELLFVLTE